VVMSCVSDAVAAAAAAGKYGNAEHSTVSDVRTFPDVYPLAARTHKSTTHLVRLSDTLTSRIFHYVIVIVIVIVKIICNVHKFNA